MQSRRLLRLSFAFLLAATFALHWTRRTRHPPTLSSLPPAPRSPLQALFVTATFWNGAAVLPHWTATVLQLAEELGRERVFVSVYESGSWDDSKDRLAAFDKQLTEAGVPHYIDLDPATHKDAAGNPERGEGWVHTPAGEWELRRIPYLAQARNRALTPLHALERHHFSHVLFLNDIVFQTEDVHTLLTTNGGSFAAACALDFKTPPHLYDTFAFRDSNGRPILRTIHPYFQSGDSRAAIEHYQPVPMQSCWNGMGRYLH